MCPKAKANKKREAADEEVTDLAALVSAFEKRYYARYPVVQFGAKNIYARKSTSRNMPRDFACNKQLWLFVSTIPSLDQA